MTCCTRLNQQLFDIQTAINEKQQEISTAQNLLAAELTKQPDPQTLGNLTIKIANLLAEKNRILYLRPAALSAALENLARVLSTVNLVEQPKIDVVLDQVADALLEVNTILEKFHHDEQPLIDNILAEVPSTIAGMRDVIGRVNAVEQPLVDNVLAEVPATITTMRDVIGRVNAVEQPKIEDIMDSIDDTIDKTDEILRQVKSLFAIKSVELIDPSILPPEQKGKLSDLIKEQEVLGQRIQIQHNEIGKIKDKLQNMPVIPGSPLTTGPAPAAGIAAKDTGLSVPATEKISDVLGTRYDNRNAYLKQLEREQEKIAEHISQIKVKIVEKPGIIPKILVSTHDSLEDTHNILDKINDTFGQGLGFAGKYNLFIKIGLGIFGVAFVVTMILIPVLLIRMILFGL